MKAKIVRRLVILAAIILMVVFCRYSGLFDHFDVLHIQEQVAALGVWGAFVYIVLHAIAPVLLLPGLPLTLSAGFLFGPVWGVVYASIGLTLGSCNAFLLARYMGRGWVEKRVKGSRFETLDSLTEKHGWKVVFIARVLLMLPSLVINYAFGLTRVSFVQYALSSFVSFVIISMIFIPLADSVGKMFQGELGWGLFISAGLLIVMLVVGYLYRKRTLVPVEKEVDQ